MISSRTNRAVVAKPEATCAGCAGLRAEILQLRKLVEKNDGRIAKLELRAEPIGLDGEPRPPGNWVRVPMAAAATGYKESGIWAKARRGEIPSWKRGGPVYVDLDSIVHKNTSFVQAATGASPEVKNKKDRHR